jgi:hypothetical protein
MDFIIKLLASLLPRSMKVRAVNYIKNRWNLVSKTKVSKTKVSKPKVFHNIPFKVDILVYFPSGVENLYQIRQWLPVFEATNDDFTYLLLLRDKASFLRLKKETDLPMVCVEKFRDLEAFYLGSEFKLCFYVNNSALNFHSLLYTDLLHVHINHGESEKASMSSNQVKAYDFVYVVAERASQRYMDNVINLDFDKLIQIGRPQLAISRSSAVQPSKLKTVLYAPTWEGGRDEMGYSSLLGSGLKLVEGILESGKYRLIYRPHPKTGSSNDKYKMVHKKIISLMKERNSELLTSQGEASGESIDLLQHVVSLRGDIQELWSNTDLMVSDVSSVIIDFLWTKKPVITFVPRRFEIPEFAQAGEVVEISDAADIVSIIEKSMCADKGMERYLSIRERYLGSVKSEGGILNTYVTKTKELVAVRDTLVLAKNSK